MLHRSRTNSFPVRLRASRQPAPPSPSGVSGPPETSFCGGIVSARGLRRIVPSWLRSGSAIVMPLGLHLDERPPYPLTGGLNMMPAPAADQLAGRSPDADADRAACGVDAGDPP